MLVMSACFSCSSAYVDFLHYPQKVFLKSWPFRICHCFFYGFSHFSQRELVKTNHLDLSMYHIVRFLVLGINDSRSKDQGWGAKLLQYQKIYFPWSLFNLLQSWRGRNCVGPPLTLSPWNCFWNSWLSIMVNSALNMIIEVEPLCLWFIFGKLFTSRGLKVRLCLMCS